MNWQAISTTAELAGALAVVIMLGYLAAQVRHSHRVASDTNTLSRWNSLKTDAWFGITSRFARFTTL